MICIGPVRFLQTSQPTHTGTWNAVSGKVEFEGVPCVFDIKAQEVDQAQIEATLWESAPDGCVRVFGACTSAVRIFEGAGFIVSVLS
jgi:hypothetical protein